MNTDDKIILRYEFKFAILRTLNEVKGTKNLDVIRFFPFPFTAFRVRVRMT